MGFAPGFFSSSSTCQQIVNNKNQDLKKLLCVGGLAEGGGCWKTGGAGVRVIKISKCSHEFSLARVSLSCLGLAASIGHMAKGISVVKKKIARVLFGCLLT